MPHKHKRKENDKSTFDLPPSSRAVPLPVSSQKKKVLPHLPMQKAKNKPKPKSKGRRADDDTPRAFARLMQYQKTGRSPPQGLDNGESARGSKKRKRTEDAPASVPAPHPAAPEHPKLLPGERLSDFALRVDQALPLSLPRHSTTPATSTSKIPGIKERTTKHNKRLLKMQEGWREEERRRMEKRAEELDEMEDEKEGEGMLWNGVGSKKSKKRKGNKGSDDDDPWAELAKSRQATKQKNLQDVVKAPPQLKKVKSRFKDQTIGTASAVVDVNNIPTSVGSLRKREEMGATRQAIIEGYRKIMRKDGQSLPRMQSRQMPAVIV